MSAPSVVERHQIRPSGRPAPAPLLAAIGAADIGDVEQVITQAAGRAALSARPLHLAVVLGPSPLSTHPVMHVLAARERCWERDRLVAEACAAAAELGVEIVRPEHCLVASRAFGARRRRRLLARRLEGLARRLGAELHPLPDTP